MTIVEFGNFVLGCIATILGIVTFFVCYIALAIFVNPEQAGKAFKESFRKKPETIAEESGGCQVTRCAQCGNVLERIWNEDHDND